MRHKCSRWLAATLLVAVAVPAAAQQDTTRQRLPVGQVISVAGAAAVFMVPHVLNIRADPPDCAPCDRARVPAFDRWSIHSEIQSVSMASTVVVGGMVAYSLVDQARGLDGERRALATVEAMSWAMGVTEVAKAIFDRSRPVFYTADAPDAVGKLTNQRSMPSGHTAAAFALATSYLLDGHDHPEWLRATMLATAVGVGVMRVVAGRHFPSDVVVGAGVGVASAIVVHTIRF